MWLAGFHRSEHGNRPGTQNPPPESWSPCHVVHRVQRRIVCCVLQCSQLVWVSTVSVGHHCQDTSSDCSVTVNIRQLRQRRGRMAAGTASLRAPDAAQDETAREAAQDVTQSAQSIASQQACSRARPSMAHAALCLLCHTAHAVPRHIAARGYGSCSARLPYPPRRADTLCDSQGGPPSVCCNKDTAF